MGLVEGLRKTRRLLGDGLAGILGRETVSEEDLEEAEEVLLGSDLGWELTEMIIDELPARARGDERGWRHALADLLLERIPVRTPAPAGEGSPQVDLVVGVNGSGKTTTIARLARCLQERGQRILLACADTFRPAAAEQLSVWAERLGTDCLTQLEGADPGAVAFDAIERARSRGYDRVMVDTAGRLPNRSGLMKELTKVHRVCGKAQEGAPHRVLLVLDGTVGQNALAQAEQFLEALPVTGLVVTKLDGTARGGAVLAMASRLEIPIEYVGVGEGADDLVPFDQRSYVRALLGLEGEAG
jgi:fused signal recognition particle receptor